MNRIKFYRNGLNSVKEIANNQITINVIYNLKESINQKNCYFNQTNLII